MAWDDLQIFGSGAASDGGAQPDHTLNLGGYRSSSEIVSLAAFGTLPNVTIERADGLPGVGALESDGAGNLRWSAPGSSEAGPWVAVDDGETTVLPDGSNASHSIRVSRSGAVPPLGSVSVTLEDIFNGAVGCANVAHADRLAGQIVYRCWFLQNAGDAQLSVRLYLASADVLALALEDPSVGGNVQTIASETTAPVGLTFVSPVGHDHADVLEKTLAAGETVALWLRRTTAAGALASPMTLSEIFIDQFGAA